MYPLFHFLYFLRLLFYTSAKILSEQNQIENESRCHIKLLVHTADQWAQFA